MATCEENSSSDTTSNSRSLSSSSSSSSSPPPTTMPLESQEITWNQLFDTEFLTSSESSWIYTALYQNIPVIIKTINPENENNEVAKTDLENEMKILSKLNHGNIVKYYGSGFNSRGDRFIVLEQLESDMTEEIINARKGLNLVEALSCARSIADALFYCQNSAVEGSMVLHRDLKPDNIGFGSDGGVRLMDFGLAREVEHNSSTEELYVMSGGVGSVRYMAPEVALKQPYNQKADIYSFGIILWELLSGKKAFENVSYDTFHKKVIEKGVRPNLLKRWPVEVINLMDRCWNAKIEERPDLDEIISILDSVLTRQRNFASKATSSPISHVTNMRRGSLNMITSRIKSLRRTSNEELKSKSCLVPRQ